MPRLLALLDWTFPGLAEERRLADHRRRHGRCADCGKVSEDQLCADCADERAW